jgi:catechol 2,3-dioxygenase-like lactoylglutathione lyase family enzyme
MARKESDVAIPILAVRDMPRVMAFYAQLGFKLLGPGAAPDPYVIAKLGTFEIHLWQTKKAKIGMAYLRTRSVRRIHARLTKIGLPENGAPCLSKVIDQPWGMRECLLVDPEGNLLRIGEFT